MNLFPRSLARLPYFLRLVVFIIVMIVISVPCSLLMQPDEAGHIGAIGLIVGLITVVVSIAATIYALMFIVIPRIRNCGWSPWLVIVYILCGLFGLVLLFMPPADPNAPDVQ